MTFLTLIVLGLLSIILICVAYIMGYKLGGLQRGRMIVQDNELPFTMMKIVSSDEISTVLEEVGPKKRRYLVSTNAFGGNTRPEKALVRKVHSDQAGKKLCLQIVGYPPAKKK